MMQNNNFEPYQPKEEHWRKMLEEDADEELWLVVQRLSEWDAPTATPEATARLVQNLALAMPKSGARWKGWLEWWPLLLLMAQMRVLGREIWAASALVIAFGTLVTWSSYSGAATFSTLPLVIVAPLVTALGVAFLYNSDAQSPIELEEATLVATRLLLLARLLLLFGFNLIMGLAGSVVLAVVLPQISLWPLVWAWLAPMTFLAMLAFCLSVIWAEPLVGVLVSLVLWMAQCVTRLAVELQTSLPITLPDLTGPQARPWLLSLSLLLGGLALWLAGRNERWLIRLKKIKD